MNEDGDDEQGRTLQPGVRGKEAMRRRPPGVEGIGGARCTRIIELEILFAPGVRGVSPLLGVMEEPGMLGGSTSIGPGCGSGVVGRDMVGSDYRCGYEDEGEGEEESTRRLQVLCALGRPKVEVKGSTGLEVGTGKRSSEM